MKKISSGELIWAKSYFHTKIAKAPGNQSSTTLYKNYF